MTGLATIEELDLTPPDKYTDLQTYLARNFALIRNRMLAPEIGFSTYDALPDRASVTNLHGGLQLIASALTFNSGSPMNVNTGLGKVFFMPQTLIDGVGTVTITGTKVDRASGVETASFVETVSVNWTAPGVDSSTTDANGNLIFELTNGFMTTNWFKGAVVVATPAGDAVSFSNVDVYGVGFEQLNASPLNELDTFDINMFVTSTTARFDAYLYSLIVDEFTGVSDIQPQAGLHLGTPPVASRYYRLRDSTIHQVLNGARDGFFCQLHYSASPARIEDVTTKVWLNNPKG